MAASAMDTVLWISAVGIVLLMLAIGGLVGLMYLLTSPLLRRAVVQPPSLELASNADDDGERERRQTAAALAVAIACAETTAPLALVESSSEWRHMHRAARLRSLVVRKGAHP